eukprot:365273-Chlamydomonas_euryale.AAC.11
MQPSTHLPGKRVDDICQAAGHALCSVAQLLLLVQWLARHAQQPPTAASHLRRPRLVTSARYPRRSSRRGLRAKPAADGSPPRDSGLRLPGPL